MIKLKETADQRNVLLFTLKAKPEDFLKEYSIEELKQGLKDLKKLRTKAKCGYGKAFYDMDIIFLERYIRERETIEKIKLTKN